jgi:GNAT superfamily N-acetyltransferase
MIREIQVSELPVAVCLAEEFWQEGDLPGKFNMDVFISNWTKLIDIGMGKIFGLFHDENLVGCLGALMVTDINDGLLTASETFWFVRDSDRGDGIKLLLHFVRYAKEVGCVRLGMVHLTSIHSDKLASLYLRMGFKPVEVHYLKNLT